ncbi:Zinc finger AN1-type [Penicillium cf. griseofulvum]|uniref:Zinc finger AN1-type n=1 Tax=Penicillium cf. griseofulvum TaxID=2972120 RepID=A0A9W9MT89_9EURO|nr:Zinc finger AN1-type [Penicillium cf. griseofulvum]KAJ5446201.1 Zinc finger AN1-type [Penicillium cf. griseofulvum]KAJ5447943.1 Zinc finger AN1-type [Penicillium cf. griseofulvum]
MSPITVSKGRSPSSDPKETFTQMADTDLESLGRHCQYEYCGQLDFLPFRCESCRGTYCLDHRTETAHQCPREGEWARRRNGANTSHENRTAPEKPSIYNTDQCAHTQCKTLINTLKDPGVRCPQCNHQYCLKHRLREEHECAKITPLGARQHNTASPNDTIKSMFARVRTWGRDKQQAAAKGTLLPTLPKMKPKPNSPAARAVAVNGLKRSAKGDASIPVDKRLYLHTVGTAETQAAEPPAGDFFFDSRWKVGRVLDDAAKKLRVQNLNNRVDGEDSRLRVFHVESGNFLEFSEAIGAGKVNQGDTIVLLRGAGAVLGSA